MSNEELARSLEKIHTELAENPQLDASTLASMRTILTDIQSAIERYEQRQSIATSAEASSHSAPASDEEDEPETITERVQDLVAEFEARHPNLTATLAQIADRLNDMGI